jgi:hypothetical protein
MQYGRNYDYAVKQYRQSKAFLLGRLAYLNNGPDETLESDFLPTDDVVVLYTFLDELKPLPANSNLY